MLECSNLVTKCPSKYENADNALQVSQLLGYGNEVIGKVVKVTGTVAEGTLAAAGQGDRVVLAESDDKRVVLPVTFDGALSDEVTDGTTVVLTGAMTDDGKFAATDVALEG